MIEPSYRPLRAAEKRLMRAKVRALDRQARRGPKAMMLVAAAVFAALWAITLAATTAPWTVVTAFWLLVGGGITTWIWFEQRRDLKTLAAMARGVESALAHDRAEVYDIRASSFAEFEEFEDEGACYAFQLDDGNLLFLAGQEFYPSGRFPSLDFSLVYPLDRAGNRADMYIEKRGDRARSARMLGSAERERLEIMDSIECRPGTIDAL